MNHLLNGHKLQIGLLVKIKPMMKKAPGYDELVGKYGLLLEDAHETELLSIKVLMAKKNNFLERIFLYRGEFEII